MIDIVNLWHYYGARPSLRDINLRVEPGQVVAVMGPNGMGKSTLLSVVAGILPAWRGRGAIDGQIRRSSIETEKAIRHKVA